MNTTQFLCTLLAEECSELAQISSKTIRFGPNEVRRGQSFSNIQRVEDEYIDVYTVYWMLQKHVNGRWTTDMSKDKMRKILRYAEYSFKEGQIGELTLTELHKLTEDFNL